MTNRIAPQRGLSLIGMILITGMIVIVGILGMKVVPEVIEYFKIVQAIKATAADTALAGASVGAVRNAYERRVIVDQISSVQPKDLDVSKDGNRLTLSFAYEKKIPLFGPVSLLIDFEGTTSK
jgi:hypothetical protein